MKKDSRILLLPLLCCCVLLFMGMRWSQRKLGSTLSRNLLLPKLRRKSVGATPLLPKFGATALFYSADSKFILSKVLSSSVKDVNRSNQRRGFHMWNGSTGEFIKSWPLNHAIRPSEKVEYHGQRETPYLFFQFDTNQLGFYTDKIPYEEVRGDIIYSKKAPLMKIQCRKNIRDWLSFAGVSIDYSFIQLPTGLSDDFPLFSSDYLDRKSGRFRTNTIGKSPANWPLWRERTYSNPNYQDSLVYLTKDDKFAYFAGVDKSNGRSKLFLSQRGSRRRDEIRLPMEANRFTWNDSAEVADARLRFSPDGRFIAFTVAQLEPRSSSQDIRAVPRFIYVFDVLKRRYQCKIACQSNVTSPEFAFSMDSLSIVTIETQGVYNASLTPKQADSRLIDLKSGRTLRTFSAKQCGFDFFTRVAFAPSGREFALSGYGSQNLVRVFRYQ